MSINTSEEMSIYKVQDTFFNMRHRVASLEKM